jgi:hypothetical protein
MGRRKSDCQFECRWNAREAAYHATTPAGSFFSAADWSDFDHYVPSAGDPQWDEYALCMDICNEVFVGPGADDSAFTTPWPTQD